MDDYGSKLQQLSNTFTEIPFIRILGLKLSEISATHANLSFSMKPDLVGNYLHGILHGGVISSVLDMAGGIVIMTHAFMKNSDKSIAELGQILGHCSTVDLQISFLRPGRGETFTASATLLKSGSKISFTRMELINDQNELIATGNGTYTHP